MTKFIRFGKDLSAFFTALAVGFLLSLMAACGTNSGSKASSGSSSSGSGSSGSGSSGGSSSSGTSSGTSGTTLSQTARFVYVTESQSNSVAAFNVNSSDGSLTPTTQAMVSAGTTPERVAADSAGKFLYVANNASNNLSVYSIASNGSLTAVPGSPFAVSAPPVDVTVHPSGKFVFVAEGSLDGGTQGVFAFTVASNGSLTPVAGSPFAIQKAPTALLTDPSGRYLYVAASGVEAFTIDGNSGALTPIAGSPYQALSPSECPTCGNTTLAFNLAIDPSGTHLYTADAFAGSIDAFNIDESTGALSHMSGAPFIDRLPTGQSMDPAFNPYGITIEPHGKFLYGYDSGDNDISIFPINGSGALGPVQKTSNTFGGICAGQILKTDPSGKFLYGLGSQGTGCAPPSAVIGFGINQGNGSLSMLPGEPYRANTVPFQDGIAVVP
jgi:6-phosphogluconolactonase